MATIYAAHNLTGVLRQIGGKDRKAAALAMEFVYDHLRGMAKRIVKREFIPSRITPTELLHDVYVRHLHGRPLPIQNRNDFFALVGKFMRDVMVDHARRRNAAKRGKGVVSVPLDECASMPAEPASVEQTVLFKRCFAKLEALDPEVARVLESRHLHGCTIRETSERLGLPEWRVREECDFGEVWLLDQLGFSADARRAPNSRAS